MSTGPDATKGQRLAEVFRRLAAAPPPHRPTAPPPHRPTAPPPATGDDGMNSIPNIPANYLTDGRIYPPQVDRRYAVVGRPDLKRYASTGHNTFIRDNGAITVALRKGPAVFEKTGADGQSTEWEARS